MTALFVDVSGLEFAVSGDSEVLRGYEAVQLEIHAIYSVQRDGHTAPRVWRIFWGAEYLWRDRCLQHGW